MDNTWLQSALDWVQLHPNTTGVLIFLVALGESLLLVGILLPGAAMLVGLGTLIGLGVVDFKTAWITASIGAFTGDGISFWIGFHYKQKLLKIWPMYKFPKLIGHGQTFFSKWGTLSVFIGRFVGLVRPIIPAIAGMMEMPIRKYIIISTIAAILWSPFYLLPGMLFGNAMGAMSKVAGTLALLVVIFVVTVAFIYWIMQLLYGFLLPRTHRILSQVLVWSQKHPLVGKFTAGLIDPRKPEKGSLAFMAFFIIALTIASLFVILNSQTINQWSIQVDSFMQAFHTDWTEPVMLFILALTHDLTIFIPSLLVFIWLVRRKRGVAAGHWGFIVITGYILALLINYFSTAESKGWFGFHHLTWFVTVIAFWAALISGSLPHKLRSWPYTLATLLIAMAAFAQLFFMQMGLGVVLISIFSSILWAAVVAIAYRMRVRKQFLGWPVSAIFFSFQGITIIFVLIFLVGQLNKHMPTKFQQITQQQWLNGTLEDRNDWLNRPKQAFHIKYSGNIDLLASYLQLKGFKKTKPKAWKDIWTALSIDKNSEDVPIIPATNKGKIESLIFARSSGELVVALHLWQEPFKITASNAALYSGYVSYHKKTQKFGLSFWQSIDDKQAIIDFINDFTTNTKFKIIKKNSQYFIQPQDTVQN